MHPLDTQTSFQSLARDSLCDAPLTASRRDCSRLWRALVQHETQVVDHFVIEAHSYLVMGPRVDTKPPSFRHRARNQALLERFLLGESAKAVAIEFRLSDSAVATVLKRALRGLGLQVLPSLVPPCLVTLVHAALGEDTETRALLAQIHRDGENYAVVSAAMPTFSGLVSPALADVLALRVEGKTYAEIAATRGTSSRTVANQIASAFRHLNVSRRAELFQPCTRGVEEHSGSRLDFER